MVALLGLACVGLVLGVTYALGRRQGLAQGREMARAEVPIELRSRLLLEQRCPICDDEQVYPVRTSQKQG